MRDAGCGLRALRIPHPALVKVAECGLRNQARLPFSASVELGPGTIHGKPRKARTGPRASLRLSHTLNPMTTFS